MPPNVAGWWTDEKVIEKVTSRFIHTHLRPNEAEFLTKSVFGELSDDTYLDWILTRSRRFFLALCDVGVPDQIFGIIDDSFDDDDLPIPEEDVPALRLSMHPDPALDRRFYQAQFKYLIRVVGDGEHIRYAKEETVPVVAVKSIINNGSKESLDKITLPSDTRQHFSRKTIAPDSRYSEEDILVEIADCRRLAHQHVLSIYGSYTVENTVFVLLTPIAEISLKSFLNDAPKSFTTMDKVARKRTLLMWPLCLANGLAWLHVNGRHHGCIRPSRIHLDERLHIFLGQLDGDGILGSGTVKDDIEAYQYAAPEKWKRSVTIQNTGKSRVTLPSGGRTARKLTLDKDNSDWADGSQGVDPYRRINHMRTGSTMYAFAPTAKGNKSRLRLGRTAVNEIPVNYERRPDRHRAHRTVTSRGTIRGLEDEDMRPSSPSYVSSNSEENGRVSRSQTMSPTFIAPPELRTTMVQTWKSVQHDMLAADVFSLGTIIMEILTLLCKHSSGAFAKHRSAKNRSAGRGGGLADASFHANIGQVHSWAETLRKDSEKKVKKDGDDVARAVGPILQVVMPCLEREPRQRMTAEELAGKLEEYIQDFARISRPHCKFSAAMAPTDPEPSTRHNALKAAKGAHPGKSGHHVQRSMSKLTLRDEEPMDPHQPTQARMVRHSIAIPSQHFEFEFDGSSVAVTEDDQFMSVASQQSPSDDETAHMTALPRRPAPGESPVVNTPRAETSSLPRLDIPQLPPGNLAGNRTFWLQTAGARGQYHYTPPPTQSPNRELPPTPPSSEGSSRRLPKPARTKASNRSSRMIDQY